MKFGLFVTHILLQVYSKYQHLIAKTVGFIAFVHELLAIPSYISTTKTGMIKLSLPKRTFKFEYSFNAVVIV